MPPNKAYLDSTHKLILDSFRSRLFLLPTVSAQRIGLQSYLRPLVWSSRLRAMMESRARGANR